jgi:hypothetical protein
VLELNRFNGLFGAGETVETVIEHLRRRQHLTEVVCYAWCLDQAGSRKDALAAYRKVLALAWKKEVIGTFSFEEWVQNKWNAVKSGNNPLRAAPRRSYIGPGVCFSREIIGYMLKLLDPVKDAKEITDLQAKRATLGR